MDELSPGLGDEALAASSGQVVVGKESKYRVIYRLVNTVYVLGITSADLDDVDSNIFACACMVNQAVSVVVAACKGVDVTPDKLSRKYTEVYMALDVVLHGVSAARLSTILSTFHAEGVSNIVTSATELENKSRGADSWNQVKVYPLDRLSNIEVLSNTTFELPEETLAAGDEAAAAFGTPSQTSGTATPASQQSEEKLNTPNADPFAASDAIVTPESDLVGKFQKSKDAQLDVTAGLADLTVPTLPLGGNSAQSTSVAIEGFEGDYGGVEFGDEAGGFGDAFEGFNEAFGGGLDPSEFGATTAPKDKAAGLGGLELLEGGGISNQAGKVPGAADGATKPTGALELAGFDQLSGGMVEKAAPIKGPLLWLTEEISAEFEGLTLLRVGLQGSVQLQTLSSSGSGNKSDIEFSFSLDGAAGIKRAVVQTSVTSSLGKGLFHVRTAPSDKPLTLVKYRLQPRFTPLPLRVRLFSKSEDSLLSIMVQYVANPYLPGVLKDVNFILSLPFSPISLKMSPRGTLDRTSNELRWQVPHIEVNAPPQRLRAQLPIGPKVEEPTSNGNGHVEKPKIVVRVEFSCSGETSLSGIVISPTAKDTTNFTVVENICKAGQYLCS